MTRNKKLIRGLAILVAYGVACFASAPYFGLNPADSRITLDPGFGPHYGLLVAHIYTALAALLIGPFQFFDRLRLRSPRYHRVAGKIYLSCVFVSGTLGLVIAFHAESFTRQAGFLALSVLWLFTGWEGYSALRKRSFYAHRRWMLRNYAVTLVAVTARLIVPFCLLADFLRHGVGSGVPVKQIVDEVLEVNIWIGLVINLIFAEWVIGAKQARAGRGE